MNLCVAGEVISMLTFNNAMAKIWWLTSQPRGHVHTDEVNLIK